MKKLKIASSLLATIALVAVAAGFTSPHKANAGYYGNYYNPGYGGYNTGYSSYSSSNNVYYYSTYPYSSYNYFPYNYGNYGSGYYNYGRGCHRMWYY